MRLMFTAQQTTTAEHLGRDGVFDPPVRDQLQELALVGRPISVLFLVTVEEVLRWRQVEEMNIFDSGDGSQEVSKIVALGEPGELGVVIQTDVDDALDSGPLALGEKGLGRLLCKADGEEFDRSHDQRSLGQAS